MSSLLLPILISSAVAARHVHISVDASSSMGVLPPVARFFGADEPNEATTPDGKVLLAELGQLSPHQTYFRTHNLLTTCDPSDDDTPRLKWGCTNAYTEDSYGNPIYNWTIIDEIFDTYLERGVKPYAQIGFMPRALATDPEPYTFLFNATNTYNIIFTAWSHVPTSWQKWGELVFQWVKHEVELRGADEVNSWYWEVWNEPNIGYWNGTEQQYFTLYDYAVYNVRRALPTARVGGPEVAGGPSGTWLGLFLDHTINGTNDATGGDGSPLDFISFHAKGSPIYVNATNSAPGHLQMNVSASLQNVRDAFAVISSYPSQKNKPVIIGEDDPDGCAACQSDAYNYRNGLIYPSYTAVAFSRDLDLALRYNINLEGTLTWAFAFQNTSYFDGFRVLATNQIDKPIINVFRMFGKLTGERLVANSTGQLSLDTVLADSVRGASDVGVLAAYNQTEGKLAAMVWNYHDDALPKPDVQITLDVSGLDTHWQGCESANLTHYRIGPTHSNSYTKWLAMGSPQSPSRAQIAELKAAGMLQTLGSPRNVKVESGKVEVAFSLPIHAISLLVLEK
ncbi:hypothetical protein LTR01_000226 [Friedmanniomyces endolithicus]|nr:hypothetical protein LTR01_000226 [Friedmanniomyces endolithicus]KAK0834654.1 hypothetical protein LTR73_000943 [Friedmanniomyces endolithicus]